MCGECANEGEKEEEEMRHTTQSVQMWNEAKRCGEPTQSKMKKIKKNRKLIARYTQMHT